MKDESISMITRTILDFIKWFRESKAKIGERSILTVRDLVSWISFINSFSSSNSTLQPECSLVHGACLVVFDGLAAFIETKDQGDMVRERLKHFFNIDFLRVSIMKNVTALNG